MSRVVHFEINADEPERAVKFYSTVFGWKIEKWGVEEYWLASTGEKSDPGIDGAIQKRTTPGATTMNTIGVDSLTETLAKITARGGKIIQADTPIPGVGMWALCQDTEGNPFGVLQPEMR